MRYKGLAIIAVIGLSACDERGNDAIIFHDGRAVETIGDSIVAVTSSVDSALTVLNLNSNTVDTIGKGTLTSPFHVQFLAGRWFVSDVIDGKASIKIFERSGASFELAHQIDLSEFTPLPHQFAVLPNGKIVVEAHDERLVAIGPDSAETFALTERGPRPSIVVAARGGVLHAVPDGHITLYNAFGNIRWRTEWPWNEDAFVTDIAVDGKSRMHVIAGIPNTGEGLFRVYSIVGETGEVVWWSDPGARATFSVSLFGDVTPDETGRWF